MRRWQGVLMLGAVLSAGMLGFIGCNDSGGDGNGGASGSVFFNVAGGSFVSGALPGASASADRPTVAIVQRPSTVINGGAANLSLNFNDPQGPGTVDKAYVGITGDGGYYQVPLSSSGGQAVLNLTVLPNAAGSSFHIRVAVVDTNGNVSDYFEFDVALVQTGTGDVKVSLSFDRNVDVDLHVVEPDSTEIYWANRTSASGGQLDLDSNAGCGIDGVNNENIFWPSGGAPRGHYIVRVDYWASCDGGPVNYTVVTYVGGVATTYSGSFTAADADHGGPGAGRTVAEFNY